MSGTLKSELKAFEKEFKAQHGRNPTKDDIKARPEIAAKYKAYSSRRSQTPVSTGSAQPAPEASTSRSTTTPPPPEASHITPKKKSTSSLSPSQRDAVPSLPHMSPSKARAAAVFTNRSPAGKAANPFASALKDTPRTSARRYLSGAMPTPEKKRNLFSSWKDSAAMTAKPSADSVASSHLNLPDVNIFRAPSPSLLPSAAPTSSKPSSSMFFDPTRGKRAASSSSLTPFEADRKRSTSVGSDKESDGGLAQDEHQAKKPKLSSRRSSSTNVSKGRPKTKSKINAKSKHQPDSDVTMDEQPPQHDPTQPTARTLDDGTTVMSFVDADGNPQEIRVRDYHPFKNVKDDWDPDDDGPYPPPTPFSQRSRQQSTDPGSSATSVMDVDASDVPSNLVSLLSLHNSPTKKHRRHVARTKELLYKQVLQEPSLKGAPAAGLLELAQEQEDRNVLNGGWASTADGGEVGDDEGDSSGADDDWASEPEGWKDLGGQDLTGLDDLDEDGHMYF